MIRLRVLGSLELSRDDGTEIVSVLSQPKRVALLGFMAASPSAYQRRDRLLAMFWPELDNARAREALNTAINFLRRELGRNAIVSRGVDEIGLNSETCWSDVAAFRAAFDARSFADALTLYRGDLLDGFHTSNAAPFEEWLERTRAQLRSDAARAARAAAEDRESSQHHTTAISCARRALELSDDDERVLRQLLELLERLGDRAGALVAYEAFERRLADEFSAEPSSETRALIGRIRARQAVVAGETGTSTVASSAPSTRWLIEQQIGRGGMATVYRARDTAHDRPVALKMMRPELLSAGADRFLREIRITARLAHPRILSLIDSGVREGAPYLVTPYIDGESLRDRLGRVGTVSAREALEFAMGVAEALDYAHRQGVVHCDIKPENILLVDNQVVVADFGVARAAGAGAATTEVAGSRAYMSPEQRDSNAVLDSRTDLYSLGCVLTESMCGAVPRDARHADEMLETRGAPTVLRQLVGDVLATERERRLSSAALVLDRFRVVIREMDAELSRHGVKARPQEHRFATRRKTTRGLALAGVVVGIGVLVSALRLRSPNTLIGSGRLSPGDTLVVADFEVAGLDSTNVPVLTNILRLDFADFKSVVLMPTSDADVALKRMRRREASAITTDMAREIALRGGLRAVVSGRVSPLASGYFVMVRVIDAKTGNELASDTRTAGNAELELLPALARASQELRRKIGESPRDTKAASSPPRLLVTTKSLEAARLHWSWRGADLPMPEMLAQLRAAIRLDTTFAYAWTSIGKLLDAQTHHRSAARDSAFTMAYRFRDNVTLAERTQISSFYWWFIQRDRRSALAEMESALALDTAIYHVVPLNRIALLTETRQFERAEAFGRQAEGWNTVGPSVSFVPSQLAQGKFAAAESTLARGSKLDGANSVGILTTARKIALAALRFDSAEALLDRVPATTASLADRSALHRLRGRFAQAHQVSDRLDSAVAAIAAAAGARFDPTSGRALSLAREALWINHDPAAAVARLDEYWRAASQIHDIQDRIDGLQAAALYTAAGQPTKGRVLLTTFERGTDTIAKRAIYEHQQAARAEAALSDGKFAEAMRLFRASDLGPDGLPASPCAVCVLPHLARVAERAGWSDSAWVFWQDYVNRPAIARLETDQWFLPTAYDRLANLARTRGDTESAAKYRAALAALRAETSTSVSRARKTN